MNKRIYLLFISLLILCSGCTAEYTLEINEDLSLEESFTAMETAEFYNSYSKSSVQKVIGFILEPNLEYLNENGFTVTQVINTKDAGVKVQNTYANCKEYKEKSQVPNQLSSDWECTENGDEITLHINGSFSDDEQNQDGRYLIEKAQIRIVVPFEVSNHNADSYDKNNNSYIWKFDESGVEKDITLTFNKNKKVDKSENPPYIIFGIIIVVVLIFLVALSGFITSNKNRNKLD